MGALKLGRLPARHDPRTLRLASYLPATPPPYPTSVDRFAAVKHWPMYGNDAISDCTAASAGHLVDAWTTVAGHPNPVTDGDVLAAYEAVSGYIPGRPDTDNGAVMLDVLNYWRQSGIGGHRITAYVQVDPRNLPEVKTAIWLFGGVYAGADLPRQAMAQVGGTWRIPYGPGATILGGHAFATGSYASTHFGAVTWGQRQRITAGWWRRFVTEAWAVVGPDQLDAKGLSVTGLNLDALLADLHKVTG